MEKSKPPTREPNVGSTWEHLEDFVREHVQQFIQALLEEEVTELLGRTKSARREAVDGIQVSNHGGRQFNGTPAAIDALPAIVEVVKGRAAVLFDSGIRSGLDIMRALALGADFVLLGRAFQYGVAALGQSGGNLVTEILIADLKNNMSQTGCESLKESRGMLKCFKQGSDTAPPSAPHQRTYPSSGFSLTEDAR